MSARAFARVDMEGNLLTHSPDVLGMAYCMYPNEGQIVVFGAYCFKLNFTPTCVIANSNFTKDGQGSDIACPAGFQDAAVICRVNPGGHRRISDSARRLLRSLLRLIWLPKSGTANSTESRNTTLGFNIKKEERDMSNERT
jgi:hypothetical protein